MSSRSLTALVAVLVVLLLSWGILKLLPRRDGNTATPPRALTLFLQTANDTSVARVRLTGPRDTVTLERNGPSWSANGFRADPGAVARFWNAIRDARIGDVVATNPANHRRLGVASDSTWRVDVHGDSGVRSMLVGKVGPRAGTTYVRLPDNDTVRILASDLSIRVPFTADDWRDRRALAVDTSAVSRVAVQLDGERYVIARRTEGWFLPEGAEADTARVRIILSELARLRAVGFLNSTDSIARKPLGGVVVALGQSGDTLGALTLSAGPGDRWARARGDSVLYRIGYYRIERLAPRRSELTPN